MKTSAFFTFRELRNFRLLHVSQKINQTAYSKQPTSPYILNQSKIVYSFFGNAEAISPAQRRRFRESQRMLFDGSKTISENVDHASVASQPHDKFSRRKVSIFPTKRTKSIYAFSSFFKLRSLLSGLTLYTSLTYENILTNKEQPSVTSFDPYDTFSKGMQRINSLENSFAFLPTLMTNQSIVNSKSVNFFARSFIYYKKLSERTILLDKENTVTIPLSFLNNLFYSRESYIELYKTTKK